MSADRSLDFLDAALRDLEMQGLRRSTEAARSEGPSFASNDYLGLAALPPVPAPRGATGSRLISGDHPDHRALERALAEWLGHEDALLFSSGYAANVGLARALVARDDIVVSDALNHASIIDGLRLARAKVAVVPHADVDAIREQLTARSRPAGARAWVFVESYYSMDADGHDPDALSKVCREHDALLVVDEAHAIGLMGPGGRGLYAEPQVRPPIVVGTLSKALGCQGGFVVGPKVLREWLWNRARSLVFSTGLAPVLAATALDSLQLIQTQPDLAEGVLELAADLRAGLRAVAGDAVRGQGHIIPIVVGEADAALRIAESMRADGVDVVAIRPPTVPAGGARLRLTVTARHGRGDVGRAVEAFARAWNAERAATFHVAR